VGFAVGVPDGGLDGGVLGDGVGTIVGDGVVGAGVGVEVISTGTADGACVGSQCSTGSKLISISWKLEGTGGEANCNHE